MRTILHVSEAVRNKLIFACFQRGRRTGATVLRDLAKGGERGGEDAADGEAGEQEEQQGEAHWQWGGGQ